jgi:hypothetical protein
MFNEEGYDWLIMLKKKQAMHTEFGEKFSLEVVT